MKKFYSFLLVLLMAVMSMPAYSVIRSITINEGTKVNDMVPMAFSHCDSWTESEYIIPASSLSEINGKQITGLQYYVSQPTYYYTAHASMDIMVWEVSSSITTLSNLRYPTTGQAFASYSGQINVISDNGVRYIRIDFATPLVYNGGSLIINARNPSPAQKDEIHYYGQTVSGASVAGYNTEVGYVNFVDQQNFAPKTTIYYNTDGKDYVALLSNDEKELTLYYVTNPKERLGQHTGWGYVGEEWMDFFNTTGQNVQYGDPFEVEKIIIDESVRDARPEYMYWFHDFEWVTEIVGLENINTSDVFSMASAFEGIGAEVIDIRTWDFSKVTNTNRMFAYSIVQTILCNTDLSAMNQITDSRNMFYGQALANTLVGGNGTPWDANHIDKSYARPDKPGQPGYFSSHGQGIDQTSQEPKANSQKLIKDGQLLIIRDGKIYNAQGARVQ